jgi:hypothetical protein
MDEASANPSSGEATGAKTAAATAAERHRERAAPRKNRGQFKPGDARINRRGRPTGAAKAALNARKGKPLSGKLKRVVFPIADFLRRLQNLKAPWLANLPSNVKIVAMELDQDRCAAILTLYSTQFREIREGDPIPEYRGFHGLIHRKNS